MERVTERYVPHLFNSSILHLLAGRRPPPAVFPDPNIVAILALASSSSKEWEHAGSKGTQIYLHFLFHQNGQDSTVKPLELFSSVNSVVIFFQTAQDVVFQNFPSPSSRPLLSLNGGEKTKSDGESLSLKTRWAFTKMDGFTTGTRNLLWNIPAKPNLYYIYFRERGLLRLRNLSITN